MPSVLFLTSTKLPTYARSCNFGIQGADVRKGRRVRVHEWCYGESLNEDAMVTLSSSIALSRIQNG